MPENCNIPLYVQSQTAAIAHNTTSPGLEPNLPCLISQGFKSPDLLIHTTTPHHTLPSRPTLHQSSPCSCCRDAISEKLSFIGEGSCTLAMRCSISLEWLEICCMTSALEAWSEGLRVSRSLFWTIITCFRHCPVAACIRSVGTTTSPPNVSSLKPQFSLFTHNVRIIQEVACYVC